MDDRNYQCSSTALSFMLVVIDTFNCQRLLLLIIAQQKTQDVLARFPTYLFIQEFKHLQACWD